MSFGPKELQLAIYNKLTGDSTLMALITGVYDFVPEEKAFPFLSIGDLQFTDRGSSSTEGYTCLFTIHTWQVAKGRKSTYAIQAEIDRLLHESTLSISGWNNLTLRRQFSDVLVESDSVTYHGISSFRILIGAT